MDRFWLLTWTTYGTWLPGDPRGFVGPVRNADGGQVIHNIPGTPYDADLPSLAEYARQTLKCPPVYLNTEQADRIGTQFHETAEYRGWEIQAFAVMANHCHIVVGVPGDPEPSDLLRDFKSYASRALNRRWKTPASGTWWAESGSKRKLPDADAVRAAVRYVQQQENAWLIWVAEEYRRMPPGG